MRILVIGAGMYVTGRGNTGVGTVLSSLAESSKWMDIVEVVVIAKNQSNSEVVEGAINRINETLKTNLHVRFRRIEGDPEKDIPEILSQELLDCAIVSVPDHLHYAYAKELLRKKIHCLVVKPLTTSLHEAKELVELQQTNGVYAAVEFHKRFDATNLYIKKALIEGLLGKLLYFTVDYSQRITIPEFVFREWSSKTNIFQYLGVHYVDLIYFLTSFIPLRVIAVGINGVLRQKSIQTYDSIHTIIFWKNPIDKNDTFISQFSTNWIDPICTSALSDQKYKVIGTKGRIECDQKNRGLEVVIENKGIQAVNPYFSEYMPDANGTLQFTGYGHKSISLFIDDVARIQRGITTPESLEGGIRPTFREALVSTAVVDAINRSLLNNSSWEEVDDFR